jgi:Predicted membrane protein
VVSLIWVVAYLSIILFSNNEPIVFFSLGIIILIAIPLFTVGIRRLHDTNKSGLYILWNFVPFIGAIIFIAFMIGTGTKGKNKYGPDPLKKTIKKNTKTQI